MLMVTRKADRKMMADKVLAILSKCDNAEAQMINWAGPRAIAVRFRHDNGASVNIEFDGDDKLDRKGQFCMAWHVSGVWNNGEYVKGDAKFSDAFGVAVGGQVNPFHHAKCTAFSVNFDDLCEKLEDAVSMMNDGSAFR